MKIQKIFFTFGFLLALTTAASASVNPVTEVEKVRPLVADHGEVVEAAIEEFDKSVEIWVIPVPTAAAYKYKEGVPA